MSEDAPTAPLEEISCDECQSQINKAAIIGLVLGAGIGVLAFWGLKRAL